VRTWGKYHCTVDLLFDWSGLICFAKKNVCCHKDDYKPVEQEVNCTVIHPPLVFPGKNNVYRGMMSFRGQANWVKMTAPRAN
jgi:hypothetical protein